MASKTPRDVRDSSDDAASGPRGNGDELQQQAGGTHPRLTTAQGIPVADNQNSLRPAPTGPTLLEDFILREKITHFDHERIPERIVHARGHAAHGYFELTESLEEFTTAKILTQTGVRTPVFARFSTVAGGSSSVDTPRDVRGFAVKFYTEEGNWDLVGNNIPVFFIQDALKFPDLVHSVKIEPDRGFPQATAAHDTFWDFISLMPESMHTIMWAMSDRAIPRSMRMMEGFGVHTFRLLDADGRSTFVKFHWRPKLGLQSTLWDEAAKLQGADNDYQRRDLWEAIDKGMFPEWDLAVQLFTDEEAASFPFDHLDATKLVPEELVPLRVIGRMVLDRNPDNFFAENEQVAFCPANVVPGIDFSNDPLLAGRLFSYLDTQLKRLGGPNFHQIPVNAPKCPFAHHQRDGHMQMETPKGRVAYEPSSLQADSPRADARAGHRSFAQPADDGVKGRTRAESFADHYSQARQFYRSQLPLEQAHLAGALITELSKVETVAIRERMVGHLRHIDEHLAQRVAAQLAIDPLPPAPPAAVPPEDRPPSPALGLIAKMKDTLEGRCVALLVADGTDGAGIEALRTAVEKERATLKLVATKMAVTLKDGTKLPVDGRLATTPSVLFDAVASMIPLEAAETLKTEAAAIDWFRDAFGHLKAIMACKGTRMILEAGGIVPDTGVVFPEQVADFIVLAKTRQWEREARVRALP
jgi:catalase